ASVASAIVSISLFYSHPDPRDLHSFPTRRSSDLEAAGVNFIDIYQRTGHYKVPLPVTLGQEAAGTVSAVGPGVAEPKVGERVARSEEHTSELQSLAYLVCRLLLEKKNPLGVRSEH